MFLPVLLFRLSLVFTAFALEDITEDICNLSFKVEHNLYNDGFHRNLSYVIDSSSRHEWRVDDGACTIAMEQILPAGVYASPDEVRHYRNDYFHAILFKNPVDIELPANDATPIIMHLVLNAIDDKIIFSLPVHARYHPAVAGAGTARNKISSPKMYLKCRDERYHKCDKINKGISSVNNFCPNDITPEKCPWKEIPTHVVTDPITWDVPVGNTDHFYVVAVGTTLVIVLGSLYLLKTIHEFKIDSMTTINNKVK